MCLHAQEDQSNKGPYCNQLQLCRPQKQSILHWPQLERKRFGFSGLVSQMRITQDCVKLKCDSQSAIHLAKNQVFSRRSKHIEARYHRIRDWVESKEIWIEKIHTDDNAAYFLTKIVLAKKFKHCLNLINLVD
ncbi:hypothetical protein COP2_009341 [Malus domestica]